MPLRCRLLGHDVVLVRRYVGQAPMRAKCPRCGEIIESAVGKRIFAKLSQG